MKVIELILASLRSGGKYAGSNLYVVLKEVLRAQRVAEGSNPPQFYGGVRTDGEWGDEMCVLSSRLSSALAEAAMRDVGDLMSIDHYREKIASLEGQLAAEKQAGLEMKEALLGLREKFRVIRAEIGR